MNSQGIEDTEVAVDLAVEVDPVVDITEGAMAMVEEGEGITCIVPSSWHFVFYSTVDKSLGLLYSLPCSLSVLRCRLYMYSKRMSLSSGRLHLLGSTTLSRLTEIANGL